MQQSYFPLRKADSFCLNRRLFLVALLISTFSLISCGVIWATNGDLVSVYVFDTKLALFVERGSTPACANTTNPLQTKCPSEITKNFEKTLSTTPCSDIVPISSQGDNVNVKWGNMSYARYPIATSPEHSRVFWGPWFATMKPIVVLFCVYLISFCFQFWRWYCFEACDNELEEDEPCCYDSCQFNSSKYSNGNTPPSVFCFRAAHGSHFDTWVEYTMTASLQLLVICLNFQGFSVNELWLIFALHACLTMIGYIVEDSLDKLFMPCKHQHTATILYGETRARTMLGKALTAEMFAWIIHGTLWALIFAKYNDVKAEIASLQKQKYDPICAHQHNISSVPTWVEAILYSQVVFFSLFGGVQFAQILAFLQCNRTAATNQLTPLMKLEWKKKWRKDNLRIWQASASAYAFLNVVSKACLAIILISAATM